MKQRKSAADHHIIRIDEQPEKNSDCGRVHFLIHFFQNDTELQKIVNLNFKKTAKIVLLENLKTY